MSKRPATETLLELSSTTAEQPGILRAPKRVKFDNSPTVINRSHDNASSQEGSTSTTSTPRKKRAVSEGPVDPIAATNTSSSRYKRRRLNEEPRQRDDDEAPTAGPATGGTPTWNRDCEIAANILESLMKLSKKDEAENDALFGYKIIDTTSEGVEPYGSVDWKFEQLHLKRLQFDAIRLLIDPQKRHHPEIGLNGGLPTPVRYWAKRLEAIRLIRKGEQPWHLEEWGEKCGVRVPGRYIRPPHGHPPVIPLEYCEEHVSTIAEILTARDARRRQSDVLAQLLQEVRSLKARSKALNEYLGRAHPRAARESAEREYAEREGQQVADVSLRTAEPQSDHTAPDPVPSDQQHQKKQKKKRSRAKDSPQAVRRPTRRTPADETWELDGRGNARKVDRG